jgi:hypothetical protein
VNEAKGEEGLVMCMDTLVLQVNGKSVEGRQVFEGQTILDQISPRQALTLGYSMGFREGLAANDE